MYTDDNVLKHRKVVQQNILKAFGVDIEKSNIDEEIEKAHVEGEIHPNGKWYWKSSARGGKGDWRVIKKNKTTGQDSIAAEEVSETPIQRAQKARSVKTLSMKISYNNKVMTRAQFVEQLVKEGVKFEIAKVQAIKNPSRRVWNRMNMREQMEFEKKQKEAGMKDEYRAFFPDRTFYTITKAEYDYGQKLMSEKQNVTHVAKEEKKEGGERKSKEKKDNTKQLPQVERFMDKLKTSNSKYKDVNLVSVDSTPKGNWAVFYDGKDTGLILNGRMLDDSTIEKMGWEHHEKDTDELKKMTNSLNDEK